MDGEAGSGAASAEKESLMLVIMRMPLGRDVNPGYFFGATG
jgi:hypothetical protein